MMVNRPLFRIVLCLAFSFTLIAPKLAMPCCNGESDAASKPDAAESACCDACVVEVLSGALTNADDDTSQEPVHPATDCKGCSAVCCVKVTAVELKPAVGLAVVGLRTALASFLQMPDSLSLDGVFHPPKSV